MAKTIYAHPHSNERRDEVELSVEDLEDVVAPGVGRNHNEILPAGGHRVCLGSARLGMRRTKKGWQLIGSFILVVVVEGASLNSSQPATAASGITRTVISAGLLPGINLVVAHQAHATQIWRLQNDDNAGVQVVNWQLEFAPNGELGWHMHPGPVFVTVKDGAVTKYDENGCPRVYGASETFLEQPYLPHNLKERAEWVQRPMLSS